MHHDSYFTLRSENPSLYPPARPAPSSSPSSAHFFDPNFNVPASPPRRTRLPRSSSVLQAPPPPPPSHFKPTFLRSPKSPQTWAHVVNHDREDPTVVTRPGDHLQPDQGQYNHHLSPFNSQISPSYRPSSSGNRSYVDRWSSSTNSSPDTAPNAAAPPSQASGVDNNTTVPAATATTSPPITSAVPAQQRYQHQKTSSASPIPLAKFATSPDLSHSHKGGDYFGSLGKTFQHHRSSYSVSASARLAQDPKPDSRGLSPAGTPREFDAKQQVAVALTTTEMPPLERTSSHDEVNQRRAAPHGHSRSRSSNRSVDLSKPKAPKPPSQKAMLSRALQKANNAVQLDNNQDFTGARQAYAEACDLLHQVLQRTSADEDKRKLDAIVSGNLAGKECFVFNFVFIFTLCVMVFIFDSSPSSFHLLLLTPHLLATDLY